MGLLLGVGYITTHNKVCRSKCRDGYGIRLHYMCTYYIPSTLRLTVAESLPTTLLAVQLNICVSDSTVSLIVRVPPTTRIRGSPNVATSTPSSLVHVTIGAGFPDAVQENVAMELIWSSSSDGDTATVGWAEGGERQLRLLLEGKRR